MNEQKWKLYFPKKSYTKEEIEEAYDNGRRPTGLEAEVSFDGDILTVKGPDILELAPISTTSLIFYPGYPSNTLNQKYILKINGKKIPFDLDEDEGIVEYQWYKSMKQYGIKFDYSVALIMITMIAMFIVGVVFLIRYSLSLG